MDYSAKELPLTVKVSASFSPPLKLSSFSKSSSFDVSSTNSSNDGAAAVWNVFRESVAF